MATSYNSSIFENTYKDDFKDSDNYYRILFNSGRALQARELTQSQTIIQKEIERFGNNIFKEGATVNRGRPTYNNKYEYVKLDTTLNSLPSNPNTLVGRTATARAPAAQVSFKILEVVPADDVTGDPATLYVRYTDTTAATASATPIRVENGAILDLGVGFGDLNVASVDATGTGTKVYVPEGDYFTQGHFVYAKEQSAFVSKYSPTPSTDIGFKVTQDIVSVNDTNALYDNQGDEFNTASPGADRYRIRLELTTRDVIDSDETFVYIARMVDGVITTVADGKNQYNQINEVLAERTREESGDYVVKEFDIAFKDANDSNLTMTVSSGIAYVNGYRLEIPPSKINVPKAQEVATLEGQTIIADYGNYVECTTGKGLPNIDTFEKMDLMTSATYGGTKIGTARVRQFYRAGTYYRMHLFDIQMNGSRSFSAVKSIGTSNTNYWNLRLESNLAVLKDTANHSLLFELPNGKPSFGGMNVGSFYTQRRVTFTAVGGAGTISTSSLGAGLDLVNSTDWVISLPNTTADSSYSVASITGTSASITGLAVDGTYEALVYVDEGTGTAKSKVYTANQILTGSNGTQYKYWPDSADSDGYGNLYLSLDVADVYKVKRISRGDSDGADYSPYFSFDRGDRDNFYGISRMVPYNQSAVPEGGIYVKFDYLQHTGTGKYFDVSSYDGVLDYNKIPDYTKNNGEVINLRNVMDFRSVKNTSDGFSTFFPLPQPSFGVSADIEYYQPRKDRIVISADNSASSVTGQGKIEVISGSPAFQPKLPNIPVGSMNLYNLSLNAYTVNDSDLSIEKIRNKRYTMRDIARIDDKVDELAELTTLNLLELDTQTVNVLDSDGNPRTKAGFIADNFTSFFYSNLNPDTYRASIDTSIGTLNPSVWQANIGLMIDSNLSKPSAGGVVRKGDTVLIDYDPDIEFLNQNLASETINVNPFEVITQTGHLELSPTSDDWVETEFKADKITQGPDERRFVGDTWRWNRNGLTTSWFGEDAGANRVITGSTTVTRFVGTKRVDVQLIPFMRSVLINFRAQGLPPNRQMFPYFRGVDVSAWCREETEFTRVGSSRTDYSNLYRNATERPAAIGEQSTLITDAQGTINGSFFVPSTPGLKFPTGTSEFKLLDITGGEDANALASCRTTFTSTGILNTFERQFQTVRIFDVANYRQLVRRDPVAQSFLVDAIDNPNGLYITKVDVFFATKDTNNIPVQLQIRPMENGLPTPFPVPGGVKFLNPDNVNVPSTADREKLNVIRATETTFTFDEPVYLTPNVEYAIVLLAESVEYTVYIARTTEFVIGDTSRRISRQPTLGSLFKSQNGTTWTPDQNADMMFRIYRAEFNSTGDLYLKNIPMPARLLPRSSLELTQADSDIYVTAPGHGLLIGDGVTIDGLTEDSYSGMLVEAIEGTRQVLKVDHTGFVYGAAAGYRADNTINIGEANVTFTPNIVYNEYYPQVQTLVPNTTTITPYIKRTTGASYASGRNNLTYSGAYALSTTWGTDVILNEQNILEEPCIIASETNKQKGNLGGAASFQLKLTMATSDTKVSPVIDLQRASVTTVENVIDKQSAGSSNGFNIPIKYVAETDATAGSHAAVHITTQTVLANPAVGLKIFLAANRPSVADFYVYYRTATSDVDLSSIGWTLLNKEQDLAADENPDVYREYEYLAGGIGGELPTFTKFQVKIVMVTTNTSKPPKFRDLRAIALVI